MVKLALGLSQYLTPAGGGGVARGGFVYAPGRAIEDASDI